MRESFGLLRRLYCVFVLFGDQQHKHYLLSFMLYNRKSVKLGTTMPFFSGEQGVTFEPAQTANITNLTSRRHGRGQRLTHKHSVIVCASHSEHHPCSLILDPAVRHPHFPLVPHPANEITDFGILCDVIVAGGYRHVNHRTGL